MKKLYPVAGRLTIKDAEALGLQKVPAGPLVNLGLLHRDVHAILTGEMREPQQGEWYLSGAIPAAYRAPNNLSMKFHICRLVRTKTETVTSIV